jgi:hypothetical protein
MSLNNDSLRGKDERNEEDFLCQISQKSNSRLELF